MTGVAWFVWGAWTGAAIGFLAAALCKAASDE